MAQFDQAIRHLLGDPNVANDGAEGGYANDPHDRGGETKFGISKRQYPNVDVANLTEREAAEIYRRDYWARIRGDEIARQPVANQLFDMAVLHGPTTATMILQKVIRVKVDGVFGPRTLERVNDVGAMLLAHLTLARIQYQCKIADADPTQNKFVRGWVKRSLRMAGAWED